MPRPTAPTRACVRGGPFFRADHGQLPGRIHERGSQQGGGPAKCRWAVRGWRESALKALVTGGAGFIGSNVVKVLIEHGHAVSVLDNLTSGYRENLASFPQVEVIAGDVRDGEALARGIAGAEVV